MASLIVRHAPDLIRGLTAGQRLRVKPGAAKLTIEKEART